MLRAATRLAPPLLALALLAFHQVVAAAAPPIGLTNIAGAAGDCTVPVADAACASLFHGDTPLYPGGPAQSAEVRVAFHGGTPSRFGVYLPRLVSRAPQSALTCTAADPAAMLDVTIQQAGRTVYTGTLSGLGRAHGSPPSLLPLDVRGGTVFRISVTLEEAADNTYMGCSTATDIAWFAAE